MNMLVTIRLMSGPSLEQMKTKKGVGQGKKKKELHQLPLPPKYTKANPMEPPNEASA
jgi:hypothetical protein